MLVLSRRQDDKIVFPRLGITVEILKISGRCIRVGVDAPPDVRVLRHELAEKQLGPPQNQVEEASRKLSDHEMRNRLNKATIGIQLAQKQLEVGHSGDADQTMARVLSEFHALEAELGRNGAPGKSKKHALLVEDDANESELLAGYLRLSGFDVDTASDGCDALDYLGKRHPDVVLLDMQMPRCDGPTTITAIRGNPHHRDLKVFAVSGAVPADLGVTVGPAGVDRWFRKPLNPHALVTELKRDFETVMSS